ncbi:MAG: thrombospondin type 3 repeat-containing protein, partial [Chloroflexota bacterium]
MRIITKILRPISGLLLILLLALIPTDMGPLNPLMPSLIGVASASGGPTLTVSTETVDPGADATVTLTLNPSGNSFVSALIQVTFDGTCLSYKEHDYGSPGYNFEFTPTLSENNVQITIANISTPFPTGQLMTLTFTTVDDPDSQPACTPAPAGTVENDVDITGAQFSTSTVPPQNINVTPINGHIIIQSTDGDSDEDGVADSVDNCINDKNAGQEDNDNDNIGDVCDPDDDNDTVNDDVPDNCPFDANTDQADNDNDNIGDVCDPDDDNDTVNDDVPDNCPSDANTDQADNDNDNIGDVCDPDDDNDGVDDNAPDNCPLIANPNQEDNDNDNIGDVCDPDDDNDSVNDDVPDNCPFDANLDQADNDNDNIGDVCDPDDDNDSVNDDVPDNCPFDANLDQADNDNDNIGDVCDPDDDND